jgi:predicted GIY-YIG superfamily endonuclease
MKETTKICKDCGKDLPLSMYHYSNKPKGQLKSYCKDCSYERNKVQIAKDPVAWRYYQQRYYKENPHKYPGNHHNKKIPKVCGVYKIECLLTDDFYIGVSTNVRDRMYKHRKASGRGKQQNLYKLIQQYGWEAFDTTILEECDKSVMFERETYWIQKLQPNLNKSKK